MHDAKSMPSNDINSDDEVIATVLKKYPRAQWLAQSRLALPDADDGFLMNVIEILNGGDIKVIDDCVQKNGNR